MSKKIKIVADSKIPFLKGVLEPFADIKYPDPSMITAGAVKEADALLVRTRTNCGAPLLDGSSVKFIATATIGFDHIDQAYCIGNNIKWVSAPGCNSSSVMQYIASTLVTIAQEKKLNLRNATIGIVGVGNVGSKVAKMAKLIGMNVLLNDPPRQAKENGAGFISLDELKDKSDIITFHVPLNKSGEYTTYHMADETFFSTLNSGKAVINTSRGAVVETNALKQAISSGLVNYAALDVWEYEPDIDRELLDLVNIATPHIAGYSADGKANGTAWCIRALTEFFGLNISQDWYPSEIPAPSGSRHSEFDCSAKSNDEIIFEAIKASYDVLSDDKTLRNSPETFENQRGSYPVRREFPYFEISLKKPDNFLPETLSRLGFKLTI
ncbi:MAG: 4-phosphoerythronate dehydrogenase PdxB [Ignavibacteria bacterium]